MSWITAPDADVTIPTLKGNKGNLFFFSNYSPTLLIAFCTIWFVPTISANKTVAIAQA